MATILTDELERQIKCPSCGWHSLTVETTGTVQLIAGEVVDTLEEHVVCAHCGATDTMDVIESEDAIPY